MTKPSKKIFVPFVNFVVKTNKTRQIPPQLKTTNYELRTISPLYPLSSTIFFPLSVLCVLGGKTSEIRPSDS